MQSRDQRGLGLTWIRLLDVVNGLVPDYIHGELSGVKKKMLQLLFTSKYSIEPFFIGEH